MRKMLVASGRLVRMHKTVQILLVGGLFLCLGFRPSASAESYYGMPVVKTVSGYKVVDIRPALSKLKYVNDRAKTAFGLVRTSTPLCDVSVTGWKTLTLTANQLVVSGGRNVPPGSKYFLYKPRVSSSIWTVGALYYANGAWNAASIGASRENICNHLYDLTDGKYSSAGAFFHGWCLPWSKSYPTVVVMMDGSKATYGVVINASATVDPVVYPAAPANTYTLVQKNLNWTQAKADAESRGGYLATITSPAEWSNVLKQVGSAMLNQSVWLGATDAGSEGSWKWVTGETFLYSRWTAGQPNNVGSRQHYLQLWGSTGSAYTWDDQENVSLPYYLMESSGVSYPPAPTNHLYRLIQENLTWSQAKADAEQRGGHLATITSPKEWSNALAQVGAANLLEKEVWLGASDAGTEGVWQWVTGESWSYARWASGQPNNSSDRQHYLHVWGATGSNFQWDDMENDAIGYYLLESVAPAPVPVPLIQVGATSVAVPEGGTATFGLKLSSAPAANVTVTVSRASGDADVRVAGGASRIFTPANYGTYQTVTLAADEDDDFANGTATIQCAAPGLAPVAVAATERDNDVPPFAANINCGGSALSGGWTADAGFSGGSVWKTTKTVANATQAPMAAYQSERSGSSFRYSFASAPNGSYRVKLHFSEMGATAAGARLFHVAIEGTRVLASFDVFAAAGGKLRATTRTFDVAVADGNGLQIDFAGAKNNALVNAIEVESIGSSAPAPVLVVDPVAVAVPEGGTATFGVKLSSAPAANVTVAVSRASGDADVRVAGGASLVFTAANYGTGQIVTLAAGEDADVLDGTATIQCAAAGFESVEVAATEEDDDVEAFTRKINCGGSALSDGWGADAGFSGGSVWKTTKSVAGAASAPMAVYQSERSGKSFRYALADVPNGTYRIQLHFSEMAATSAGARIFHVAIEGTRVLANFDVFAAAGGTRRALVRTFDVEVADGNGLQIEFTGAKNNAEINGIEIQSVPGRRKASSSPTAFPRPVDVLASSGEPPCDDPWNLVDADPRTVWMGGSEARGWWVVLAYPEPVLVRAVRLDWADAAYGADPQILWSRDGRTWSRLDAATDEDPPWLSYLWLLFDDDGSGEPPAIESIGLE